jgi:hypothetical protein
MIEPTVIALMAAHEGREGIMIDSLKCLDNQGIEGTVVVGSGGSEKDAALSVRNVLYTEAPNDCLGAKWQAGLDVVKSFNPDVVLICGSDDLLSSGWVHEHTDYLENADIVGKSSWFVYDVDWRKRLIQTPLWWVWYKTRKDPIGAGRLIHRRVLDPVDWQVFPQKPGVACDRHVYDILVARGARVKLTNELTDEWCYSVKGPWEMLDCFGSIMTAESLGKRPIDDGLNWTRKYFLGKVLRLVDYVFRQAGATYWLSFGALWGLIQNRGVIPDEDFDFCVPYETDWKRIQRGFAAWSYGLAKAMLNDIDQEKALYCGFNRSGWPHICVSFWYPHDGMRYYCHDQRHELKAPGVPPSGYWFKGVPKECLDYGFRAEWPGIPQDIKIMVPAIAGSILDSHYPMWSYIRQRYNIYDHEVIPEKTVSIFRSGAMSRYAVHVQSMKQWGDAGYIRQQLAASEQKWRVKMKDLGAKPLLAPKG